MIALLLKGFFALAPVTVYLLALVALDSYKLVTLRAVLTAVVAGALVLVGCQYLNSALLEFSGLTVDTFSRYLAPVTEELAKGAYLIWLVHRRRIGFSIDAAILGFAIGTGFGALENVFYLRLIPDASLLTWILRGCGTAIMHGSTTAILGIIAHRHGDQTRLATWWSTLIGLAVAVVLHAAYNHFFVAPVLTAMGLIVGVPLVTLVVFRQSERSLERWLGLSFDTDAAMLQAIDEGRVAATNVGSYLISIREHFPPTVVADMLCLLRLQVELAIQAKGLLLMRRGGFDVPTPPDVTEKLAELEYLERSLGPTGRLALRPFLARGRRERWQRHLLRQS
jgi:RsiW-degrading membrane proteinase PrsW (M82 family)